MKYLIIGLLSITLLLSCSEQPSKQDTSKIETAKDYRKPANKTEAAILKSADSMMLAFKNRDWQTFAGFTHPAMVRVMGGADNIAFMVKQQMQNVPDSVIKSARVEKVLQVERVNTELQCVVEQKIVMEMQEHRITTTTYLIGESLNGGKSWTFFDASNDSKIKPADIKPNLSTALKIPVKKQETEAVL